MQVALRMELAEDLDIPGFRKTAARSTEKLPWWRAEDSLTPKFGDMATSLRSNVLNRVAILFILFTVSSGAFATSLVPEALATADPIRLVVVTGGLGFDPLPSLNRHLLDQKIQTVANEVLSARGLHSVQDAPLSLTISVDHDLAAGEAQWVALAVRVELTEPITTDRAIVRKTRGPFTAITWSTETLDLVRTDAAEGEILFRVRYLIEQFADGVNQAEYYLEHPEKP